jgi:predicted RND superfamily exporter protein
MFSDGLGGFLFDNKNRLAALSAMIGILLAIGLKNLYFESDYKIFFNKDHPQLLQLDKIERDYTKADNVTLIVATRSPDLFNRDDLEALLNLTREAWRLPWSLRVDSLTNFQNTWAEGDSLIVEDLINETQLAEGKFPELRALALSQKELVNWVLADDAKVTSVAVFLQLPEDQLGRDRAALEAVKAARALIEKYESRYPNLTIHLVGQTTVNVVFNELSQRDSVFWFPIMFAIMALLLVLLLRSVTGMINTLTIIAVSVASTLGMMGWIGVTLNQVTAALPVIILTLAVCDGVHILNSYYHLLGAGDGKAEALKKSLNLNLKAVFLTSLTTAIGFMSMNTSDTPPLRELGTWAAVGILFAFFYSMTLLPWLAHTLPAKGRRLHSTGFAKAYTRWLAVHWRKLLIILGATTGLLIAQIPANELNDNTIGYVKQSVPFRQAADFMQANLTGFDHFNYSLECGATNCINEPEFLSKVDRFADWLRSQPEIVHVVSYVDTIKRLNQNMHEDAVDYFRIPESRELAAQYQLLYELSLPFGLDLNNLTRFDKSALKLTVVIRGQKAAQLLELESRIGHWLASQMPELDGPAAGISIMFANLGQTNIYSMISGSLIALFLVTLTLMLALKSGKYGLISLVPNSLPAAVAFGIWGVLVGEVNVAVAVVFSFTLGIIVDDTVHILIKYLEARRDLGKNSMDAVEYALSIVGRAVMTTTVVLAAGFSVLALSDFNVNAYMGAMVAMTILIALVLDLVLLPICLMQADKNIV